MARWRRDKRQPKRTGKGVRVYLIHATKPGHQTYHVIGSTTRTIGARLREHMCIRNISTPGSAFTNWLIRHNYTLQLARTWPDNADQVSQKVDSGLEFKLKTWCNSSRFCPKCIGPRAYKRAQYLDWYIRKEITQ